MFNFEQAILEWRRQMLAAGIKAPVPLDELEGHLRDEIDHQTKSGLSEAEAFKAAVKNLGAAPVLQPEFKKVEGKKKLDEWIFHTYQKHPESPQIVAIIALSIPSAGLALALLSKRGLIEHLSFGQQISCWTALATMLLLLLAGRLSYRLFPIIRFRRTRHAIAYSSGALVALWWIALASIILPSYDLNHFWVMFYWGYALPVGACLGMLFGIETAARKQAA